MTNAARKKGSAWESKVRDFLRTNGFPDAERLPSEGAKDRGDISGVPFVLECKATTSEQLAEAMKEAKKEAENAGKAGYAVVRPNRGKSVDEAFVTCPLWLFTMLMRTDAPAMPERCVICSLPFSVAAPPGAGMFWHGDCDPALDAEATA